MASCGLANLGSCLPQTFASYFSDLLNSPIEPLLNITLKLLSEPIRINIFFDMWVIIIYMLSMFYALMIVATGFSFMFSGHDPVKRENAKQWLRNILIMIILIQASYFIYELAINLSSIMTTSTLSLVNQSFFQIGMHDISDIGLQLLLALSYVLVLLITALILVIRYAVVAVGVVLLPIAIFFYFFQPLKQYGVLILNFLGICIFVTFFDGILLAGFSKITSVPILYDMKSLVLISGFLIVDILMVLLMFFSIIKASIGIYAKTKLFGGKG
jgi:hypothetical protein